ncbi:T-complex protein 1 subunit theta [Nymphon striatum]|nr:T-complex protein 1 subunit theta [Nymphon striatum]
MAMHVPQAPGFGQMMKEGARRFHGLEEAVYRNIGACSELAKTVRSAYGPNGMNKMVINHLGKLFVTNDAATIIKELEIEHPAAKLIVMASEMQEKEIGDGTNFVIVFAGALLEAAEEILRMGITPMEICEGYELALKKAHEILKDLSCCTIQDLTSEEEIIKGIKTSIMSKQYGNENFLAKLIARACGSLLNSKESTFNVDNVRICKILGSSVLNSEVVQGMVFKRQVEGDVSKAENAKIAVYSCPFDSVTTETKGTVLIKSAAELQKFSEGEESLLENQIKSIADTGAKVIVSGGKFGEMALHFLNKYGIMTVRLLSKFDLRRLCRTVGATALPRMTPPTAEELGYCDNVYVDEVGDTSVVIFKQDSTESRIATVVIRGSTDNRMDDIERAIDDGDGRCVPGAGATEIELGSSNRNLCPGTYHLSFFFFYGTLIFTLSGLEQYSVKKFAEALEAFPKTLAENYGVKATEVISALYNVHQEGKLNVGFNNEEPDDNGLVRDSLEANILDLHITKYWAMKYAVNAACTVLRVDEIIMAKRAGGPKPKENKDWDED